LKIPSKSPQQQIEDNIIMSAVIKYEVTHEASDHHLHQRFQQWPTMTTHWLQHILTVGADINSHQNSEKSPYSWLRKPEQGSMFFLEVKESLPNKDLKNWEEERHRREQIEQRTIKLVVWIKGTVSHLLRE
jgi:hypothetical protein